MQHIFIEFLILTCKWTIKKVEKRAKEQISCHMWDCFSFFNAFLGLFGGFSLFLFYFLVTDLRTKSQGLSFSSFFTRLKSLRFANCLSET